MGDPREAASTSGEDGADDIDDLLDQLVTNGHQPAMSQPPEQPPPAPERSRRSLATAVIVTCLVGALLGGLLTWVLQRDDGSDTQAVSDPTDSETDGAETAIAATEELEDLLRGLGIADASVERRGDVVHLAGTAPSSAQRDAAIGAVAGLTDGDIDASQLVVAAGAEDVAAPTNSADTAKAQALEREVNRIVAATPLIFDTAQSDIDELHKRILNNIVGVFNAHPDVPVVVVGFTDGVGADAANEQLSLARAESVKAYLVDHGVDEALLSTEARGETSSTGSDALANLERRVEFVVPGAAGESSEAAAPPPTDALRVALVGPSPSDDLAFTQSMVDAVNVIAAERDVHIAVSDGLFVASEAAEAITGYADEGYDLVIVHGSEYGTSLVDIAMAHPDIVFAWGTAEDTLGLPNVYAYDAAAEQGGYVMGAMSTMITSQRTVGVIGPIEVGDAQRYVEGFEAGASAESADVTVGTTYTGSFSDIALAAEAANAHIDSGADVLTGSGEMVVGAVSVAVERNVAWFGTQADQSPLAPDLVVASQVYHWEVILREILTDLDAGTVNGRALVADLANQGLVIEYNSGYPLPPEVRQRADELTAGIIDGSIVVPK